MSLLSDRDILSAIKNHEMCVVPFSPDNRVTNQITPAGLNFSFSKCIVSLRRRRFYKIYEENNSLYFDIEPGDTALTLTRESIWVSKDYGGTFHSKVAYVSLGLGHVSTTLDPCWQGQLLISINNPNRKKIKVEIAKKNQAGNFDYCTFITLYLWRLGTSAESNSDNNSPARLDKLLKVLDGKVDGIFSFDSKKQKILRSVLNEINTFTNEHINPVTLSSISDKEARIRAIDQFCETHELILDQWDSLYCRVEKVNDEIIRNSIIRKWVSVGLIVLVVVLLTLLAAAGILSEEGRWAATFIFAAIALIVSIIKAERP